MHSLIGVILPFAYSGEKLHDALREILHPWNENLYDDKHNENGKWDWYQLGGRWTGVWSDYDPEKDPANHEECWLCQGTGIRDDTIGRRHREQYPEYTCNGCEGGPTPGTAVKFPTKWVARPDLDVVPVRALLAMDDMMLPCALVSAPDSWVEHETWNGKTFVEDPDWAATARRTLQNYPDSYLAAVDIHS